ncbi:hypothetical protein [Leptospira interrogans]|nr:hypothetical protein [Leptospira interrogans]
MQRVRWGCGGAERCGKQWLRLGSPESDKGTNPSVSSSENIHSTVSRD